MRPSSRKIGIAAAIVLLLILLTVVFFDWNLLRGPISRYASTTLARDFSINGDLHVHFSNPIEVEVNDVVVGNTSWSNHPVMARFQRLVLHIDLWPLFSRRIILSEIFLVKPRLLLEKNASGETNWSFSGSSGKKDTGPVIGLLKIDDGIVQYRDAELAADITLAIASDTQQKNEGSSNIRFKGDGQLHGEPFSIQGSGAALLSLRETSKPYQMQIQAHAGRTNANFSGSFIPVGLQDIDGRLNLQGSDLSKLYPLVPLPLPWTPPYKITGHLTRKDDIWTFRQVNGRVGDSDLAGNVQFDHSSKPPMVVADLVSHRLNYKDLGGLVGIPPGTQPLVKNTAEQKEEAAKRAASTKVLSDKRFNFERLRRVNAEVHFRGERIIAAERAFDNLDTRVYINNGELKLRPLDFGIGGGHVVSNLTLDVRQPTMTANAELSVRQVDLKRVFPQLKPPKGEAGKIAGQAHLSSKGNSIAELLAAMNGELALIAWGGNASTLTLVLTNLDLARAAQLLLRGDDTSNIRCLVVNFGATDGVAIAKSLVVDTSAVNVIGEGKIDLRNEVYDLRLNAHSKRISPLALHGPIEIGGTFKNPRVGPAAGPLTARLAGSLVLGALATPLVALLPLVDTGGGKDSDCPALIAQAQANVAKTRAQP